MSYQFHGQRANEEVVLLSRQHPFVLLHPFLISVLILLIPFLLYIFFSIGTFLGIVSFVCLVAALLHGMLAWYVWRSTLFLLTTERVVFLEQKGIIHREFVECTLKSIQQVAHQVRGVRQTLFKYGDIAIYTSGSQVPVVLRAIPEPYDMQQEILRAAAGEGFVEEGEEEEEE